jgi:hypothetical protein
VAASRHPGLSHANSRDFRILTPADLHIYISPESLALATATAIYSKGFLEALGKRSGEGAANLPKRIAAVISARRKRKNLTSFYRKGAKGSPDESLVGLAGEEAAMIIVTKDLPDEARLALLDLDVTADELRGKTIRWDGTAQAWLPEEDVRSGPETPALP